MSDEDKSIRNMIAFIEGEAKEKQAEIEQQAQEEYDIEKQQLVEKAKANLRSEYERKKKNLDIERRVTHANLLKEQRMRVLREREKITEALKDRVKSKAQSIVRNEAVYKAVLQKLIVQSINSIQCDVEITCRKADAALVQSVIPACNSKFKMAVSPTNYLDDNVWGGVVLTGNSGKIRCNNTLLHRARHCFDEQLPTIRYLMFN